MPSSSVIDLGYPTQGDIIDLILDDHVRFERLLRQLRDSSSAREAVREAFAALHVIHAQVEEEFIYPVLRKRDAIDAHEEEHGEEEHAEGNQALLAVLELKGTDTQSFVDAVEKLTEAVSHHLCEEEQTILNPARSELSDQRRRELGDIWCRERNALLGTDIGSLENVRKVVRRAEEQGLLEDEQG